MYRSVRKIFEGIVNSVTSVHGVSPTTARVLLKTVKHIQRKEQPNIRLSVTPLFLRVSMMWKMPPQPTLDGV